RRHHSNNPHQARHRLPWGSEPSSSKGGANDGRGQEVRLEQIFRDKLL
ncbi:unnamed protein product, partial [Musa banksii]